MDNLPTATIGGSVTSAEPPKPELQSGTGQGLIEFLDFIIERGEMVAGTAAALRTGVRKVLDTTPDLYTTDIRAIEVEEVVRVFRNRTRGTAKDRTLDQYEQRFRNSVDMYRKWLADDRDWLPSRSRAGAARTRPSAGVGAQGTEESSRKVTGVPEVQQDAPHVGMVTYPLPIRPGVKVTLILPEDLSTAEARRISSFVSAVAFEQRLGETGGPDTEAAD